MIVLNQTGRDAVESVPARFGFGLSALYCNSPTHSQAARILCASPCREAFGVRRIPALSFRQYETSLHYAKAQRRDAAHSKRFARFGCGFATRCSLHSVVPISSFPPTKFEIWSLEFGASLEFGVWSLEFSLWT